MANSNNQGGNGNGNGRGDKRGGRRNGGNQGQNSNSNRSKHSKAICKIKRTKESEKEIKAELYDAYDNTVKELIPTFRDMETQKNVSSNWPHV